jgi:arginine decarboxylase
LTVDEAWDALLPFHPGRWKTFPLQKHPGGSQRRWPPPYPPGIPLLLPGERTNKATIDYPKSGVEAGMVLPDPADPSLKTVRVVREEPRKPY